MKLLNQQRLSLRGMTWPRARVQSHPCLGPADNCSESRRWELLFHLYSSIAWNGSADTTISWKWQSVQHPADSYMLLSSSPSSSRWEQHRTWDKRKKTDIWRRLQGIPGFKTWWQKIKFIAMTAAVNFQLYSLHDTATNPTDGETNIPEHLPRYRQVYIYEALAERSTSLIQLLIYSSLTQQTGRSRDINLKAFNADETKMEERSFISFSLLSRSFFVL